MVRREPNGFNMPMKFPQPIVLLCCCLLVQAGCAPDLPSTWEEDIPGVFEGERSGFRERIVFNADGTYKHEVYNDTNLIHSETGKWTVKKGCIVVIQFTQFYDSMERQFTNQVGARFLTYQYAALPDGKGSFNQISTAGSDYEFRLLRQKK